MVYENGKVVERNGTVKKVVSVIWSIVRFPLFLIMLWLRGPIIGLCSFVRIPILFGWLFAWYVIPDRPAMVWSIAALGLLVFASEWVYDSILLELSPSPIELIS